MKKNHEPVKPICINSKGGRGGVPGLQPSIQNRIYSPEGVATAVTCEYITNVLEEIEDE